MSDISELESRLSAALERIGRGVDAMQPVIAEPDEGEDVQALRRALENEALVTAQMEERVRALTARQTELEEELSAEKDAREAAEEAQKTAESSIVDDVRNDLTAAEARAEAAETAAAAAADAAEETPVAVPETADAPEPDEDHRARLNEMGKRLRRLRQMARRERTANQVLREQIEKDQMVDPSAVNEALKADIETLTALREAELAETALILAELRPLVHGGADASEAEAAEAPVADAPVAMEEETGEA